MKFKCFILFFVTFTLNVNLYSQVTIGSQTAPDSNALLDLKQDGTTNKGLLPPRVSLSSTSSTSPMSSPVTAGMTVYNTATQNDVKPGYYYHNGSRWVRLDVPKFFYMPSIILPVSTTDAAYSSGTFTIDLYQKYKDQFTGVTPSKKNPAAINLPLYDKGELNYYITYYDDAVFSNVNVDNDGVLTYQLATTSPSITEKSFMNIIFEVK